MHSPDPDSSSSSPSDSPPPEDHPHSGGGGSTFLNIASHITSSFSGSPSKRRLPGGPSFAAASSSRDPKSRRREDPRRGGGGWEGKEGKRDKEELIDSSIVDHLRKEIGDPFNEVSFKSAS